jgi:hypothetical protein
MKWTIRYGSITQTVRNVLAEKKHLALLSIMFPEITIDPPQKPFDEGEPLSAIPQSAMGQAPLTFAPRFAPSASVTVIAHDFPLFFVQSPSSFAPRSIQPTPSSR